jgi:Flp pilus assembly protein TadD
MNSNITRLTQEALAHQHAGRIDIALSMFSEVLQHRPRDPQANFSLGIAAYQAGNVSQAIAHFQTAAAGAKKNPQVFQLLGLALLRSRDLKGAKAALQKAVSLDPKNADLHAQVGDVFRQERKPVMARQSFERALKLDPENGYALVGLGSLDVSTGDIPAAQDWFAKAIQAGKELPAAHHGLALSRSHTDRPTELDQIEQLIDEQNQQAPEEKASLHWAAGKIYYDIGEPSKATLHYQKAREIHYMPFDQAAHEERLAFLKQLFTASFFEQRQDFGNESSKPLLIFGMPRSGTTLVEQILAQHPKVVSGGELPFFMQTRDDLGLMGAPSPALEQRIKDMEPREFRKIAVKYLSLLDGIDKRASRITDKMPHNFEMLWLMALLFPKATFVHCEREPADTCMSLLSHALAPEHNYARSQESVGAYYRSYVQLMDHWKAELPIAIYDLPYEKLVTDQEQESRKLLAAAGLEWDDACLEFYKSSTPVTTFSNTQVRRPMFQSSVGRWMHHKDQLTDLFDALGDLAPEEVRKRA